MRSFLPGGAADHPRIRGEHSPQEPAPRPARGSSPHTRGARARLRVLRCRLRIIPAYAGSTGGACRHQKCLSDHPRIRGEHLPFWAIFASICGSSPHTRGALFVAYHQSPRRADHPRIRGEHISRSRSTPTNTGSSPHTRGALDEVRVGDGGGGIIPAYAGSTIVVPHLRATLGDHPRIRGEHTWKSLQYQGSPP